MGSGLEPIAVHTDRLISPSTQEGKCPIRVPTKVTDTHLHPEKDACLIPSFECNLTEPLIPPKAALT